MVTTILMWAETLIPSLHIVYLILWLMFLCELLELGKARHGMALRPPLIQRRQAKFPIT